MISVFSGPSPTGSSSGGEGTSWRVVASITVSRSSATSLPQGHAVRPLVVRRFSRFQSLRASTVSSLISSFRPRRCCGGTPCNDGCCATVTRIEDHSRGCAFAALRSHAPAVLPRAERSSEHHSSSSLSASVGIVRPPRPRRLPRAAGAERRSSPLLQPLPLRDQRLLATPHGEVAVDGLRGAGGSSGAF